MSSSYQVQLVKFRDTMLCMFEKVANASTPKFVTFQSGHRADGTLYHSLHGGCVEAAAPTVEIEPELWFGNVVVTVSHYIER